MTLLPELMRLCASPNFFTLEVDNSLLYMDASHEPAIYLRFITLELSNRLGVVKSSSCKPVTSRIFILKCPNTTAMFWVSTSSHITIGVT